MPAYLILDQEVSESLSIPSTTEGLKGGGDLGMIWILVFVFFFRSWSLVNILADFLGKERRVCMVGN